MQTGRPVKWIEDRSENLAVTVHGRDQVDYIEVAATKEGKVTGAEGAWHLRSGLVLHSFSPM